MAESSKSSSGPFRQKSLERLSSPERLDQLLSIVDRKSWLPLGTLGALVFALLLWSLLGKIPITVRGKGVLIQPRQVVALQSPGAGRLADWEVSVNDLVQAGDVLGRIARPDLDQQLVLLNQKLLDLKVRSRAAQQLRLQRADLEGSSSRTQQQSLREHIRQSRALAERLRRTELAAVAEERESLEKQWELARTLPQELGTILERNEELERQGLISREALNRAKDSYVESMARVSSLENQLHTIDGKEIAAEQAYLDRLQRIADLRFKLEGLEVRDKELARENLESELSYDQQIADVELEITRLEKLLETQSTIVSPHAGKVLEINVATGQELAAGQRLASVATAGPDSELVSLGYFTVRDGKRIPDEVEIHVSPDTAVRQRYGSIVGQVRSISDFPISADEVRNVVGNSDLADRLIEGGYLIQVFADLERDPETTSGYVWTSSDGPEARLTAGTTATVRAVVEHRRPIAFVLPFLRSTTGID